MLVSKLRQVLVKRTAHLFKLGHTFARFTRVLRSGVFCADLYRQANPDVPVGKYRALLHFCKHGFEEQREWNQRALGRWLVPHLLDGTIDPNSVNRLRQRMGALNNQGDDLLEKFCDDQSLSSNNYAFHLAYENQEYDEAYKHLTQMPMQEAFLQHYIFARRHMKMDGLHDAYKWALSQLNEGGDFAVRELVAARDIAAAIGHPDRPQSEFNQLILSAFSRLSMQNETGRLRALWQIGFPIILDDSDGLITCCSPSATMRQTC